MKKINVPVLGFGLFLLAILPCCQTSSLKVPFFGGFQIEPRFEKVIDNQQNLVFRFPRPMVKPEKIGEWDTTSFFIFQPKVSGQFKWSAMDEITFSPNQPFSFATTYTAIPGQALTRLAVEVAQAQPISFETQQLNIQTIEPQWISKSSGENRFRFRLELNQTVLPDEIIPALQVKWNGKKVDVLAEEHQPSNKFYLACPGIAFQQQAGQLEVEINPVGLPQNLKNRLKKLVQKTAKVPEMAELVVYGVDISYGETGTEIQVRLSQNPANSPLKNWVDLMGFEDINVKSLECGISISGDFPSKATMELVLKNGLKGAMGGTLRADKTIGFRIGISEPFVRFANSNSSYLPKKGNRELGFYSESVDEWQVSIYQVFPNAILSQFQNQYQYGPDEEYYSEYNEVTGSLIFSQQWKAAQLKKAGNQYFLPLPEKGFPDRNGLFIVKLTDAQHHYIDAQKMVMVTDLGLMAKTNDLETWVQASSLESNQVIQGAQIEIIGKNNQILFQGKTDNDGKLVVPKNKWAALGSPCAMITAEKNGDFSFLILNQTELETSRFEVDGIFASTSGWQAQVFGPRNLYLPGEAVDLSVLLRDRNLAALGHETVIAKIINPMGKMVNWLKTNTSENGLGHFHFSLPAFLNTGTYSVEIYAGEKELLATHHLHLESFDPIPLDISVNQVPSLIPAGGPWKSTLAVENMFGLPAGNRPIEGQISWEMAFFSHQKYPDYSFYLSGGAQPQMAPVSGQTDQNGKATLSLPLTSIPAWQGLVDVSCRLQVFDDAQIPVYKTLRSQMLTQPSLIGFKIQGNRLRLRQVNKINLVSISPDGKLVPATAWIDINLMSYERVMESAPNEPSGYRYVSRRVKKKILHQSVPLLQGMAQFPFFPKTPGDYEMEIRAEENAGTFLPFTSYVYESEMDGFGDEAINQEGNVEIKIPAKTWTPGEKAEIRMVTPFDGMLTVTIEQNKILSSFRVKTTEKLASLSIPITEEMCPNAYISATLTRSFSEKENTNPLTTAYGYASIQVVRKDRQAKLDISVPNQIFSGKKLPIEIETDSEDSELSLALVDDGILQITRYRIQDPMAHFHRKQALKTHTYSLFGKVINGKIMGKGQVGGDGLYMKMANDELDTKQLLSTYLTSQNPIIKDVGELKSIPGSKRKFRAEIQVPPGFSGRAKVMVLCCTKKQFAYAEKTIIIADPIALKTALPDFLSPGNYFEGIVSFFNTTNKTIHFQPGISASSATVKVEQTWPSNLTLRGGEVIRLPYSIKPLSEGMAKITVEANSNQVRLSSKYKQFPVSEPEAIIRHQKSGKISPGQSMVFSKPEIFSNRLNASIEIGHDPWTSFGPGIEKLINYPFGCLEQTISAVFPLLYIPDEWLARIQPKSQQNGLSSNWKKHAYVTDAIQKISSLQHPGGGFSYWPGGDFAFPYYSIYATHFLWEAQKAGFYVQPEVLNAALNFSENISKENAIWWFSGEGQPPVKKLAPKTPYALFVTSLAGRPNRKALLQWKSQPEMLDQEGQFMTAAALQLAGDGSWLNQLAGRPWEKTIFPTGPVQRNNYSNEFAPEVLKTPIQEETFVLGVLSQCWPTHPVATRLAEKMGHLVSNQSQTMSTQELGMAISALARMKKSTNGTGNKFLVKSDTKTLSQNSPGLLNLGKWNESVSVHNTHSNRELYYWIKAEGVSTGKPLPEEENGLILKKTFYDYLGNSINPEKLKINQLVIVRLSLASASGFPVDRIALVDRIPSCFRIENKRIDQSSGWKLPTEASEPEYFDIRRDRINIFCSAEKHEKSYYFAVRVIGNGKYEWPSCEAQAMYQPAIYSRKGGKRIEVQKENYSQNFNP